MKTIQIEITPGPSDDRDLLKAAGIKRIHPGWWTVRYNGVALDQSTIVGATRNRKGQINDQ